MWRIAVETPDYSADDLTGAGALQVQGRWNSAGTAMTYCSTNIALAVLESLVHSRFGLLPFNRYLIRVDIPDTTWAVHKALTAPPGWDAIPPGRTSILMGDSWAIGLNSLILLVPSAIVPEESNVLINPRHPAAATINATTVRRWIYDPRLY